ncbi:MAG: Flp pilus assembly protein CpaB [Actinomycetota bacterium]|nr:Flp pilus assembly protein CpaB [Actinomycetota bacterium]
MNTARGKNNRRLTPGLTAAAGTAFAILAGLLILGFFAQLIGRKDSGQVVRAHVAARNIPPGILITKEMVSKKDVPEKYVVPGTIKKEKDIIGARTLRFIGKGEPFTASCVVGSEGAGPLAARIPADSRAYTLRLDLCSGAGPDIRPGDRVDVLSTCGEPPATRTLLRNRLVLSMAIGGREEKAEAGAEGVESVTLLVHPEEAELLAQAELSGEISISLCPMQSE